MFNRLLLRATELVDRIAIARARSAVCHVASQFRLRTARARRTAPDVPRNEVTSKRGRHGRQRDVSRRVQLLERGESPRVDQTRGTPLASSSLIGSPFYSAATGSVYASNYRDITSGNNTVYSAGTGYDLATGLGSPLANNLAPYLAAH